MWDNILGHERQKKFLQNYLRADERPHALLFVGAEGLGKKQLALAFAKALLCFNHTGTDGCEACRLLNLEDGNLSHPDFILVQRELNPDTGRLKDISIDQIKELIGKAAFAPVLSPVKVCLVEDADRMSVAAANSFLKLLEEPPAGWVIVLLASAEAKLLTTILSRVVCLRFQPVSAAQVANFLAARGVAAQEAEVLARISEGSVGLALDLQRQKALELRQQALAFAEALPLAMPLNYLAGRVWQQKNFERPQALLFVKLLQLLLRDLLMCKLNLTADLYNCDLREQLQAQSAAWRAAGLKLALAATQEAYAVLESSAGVRMTLEALALKIDQAYKE
ncbi:MAG: DNA polymerase III subunit delta' [Phascolarctobacterium sp.]|uniref:DNA polymerase III subunit n=1 Tax=Phascolarctobacterium sp. TaxID=2049039 RepID=UPI0026DD4F6A|nr:DNA polymerase III subunit delta' [Phascolarctobacterium sp.]MDO4921810.1 DNA polymerase III subunit delta' [Phascolarctobacterium sp.]